MVGIRLKKGERVRLETPGGGGYGPAGRRAPQAIAEDIRLGYVTRAAAVRDYGKGARRPARKTSKGAA
jgi:N-methylhydantoinase B